MKPKRQKRFKRSLYQCLWAKVRLGRIYCAKGYLFAERMDKWGDGTLPVIKLERGDPMEMAACQACRDYDEMGGPVPWGERGWLKVKVTKEGAVK